MVGGVGWGGLLDTDAYAPSPLRAVAEHFSFPDEEVKVLKLWEDLQAFETSLKLAEGRPQYSFYDGPPFATGLPHYGHLLAGTIKVCWWIRACVLH